jgi:hypothetical protein
MATKGRTGKAKTAEPVVITTEKPLETPKAVNPYSNFGLSIPELLRAILCEIWELRQDVIRSGFFIGHKKDFEEFADIYKKSVK